jgi:hypothetical protein
VATWLPNYFLKWQLIITSWGSWFRSTHSVSSPWCFLTQFATKSGIKSASRLWLWSFFYSDPFMALVFVVKKREMDPRDEMGWDGMGLDGTARDAITQARQNQRGYIISISFPNVRNAEDDLSHHAGNQRAQKPPKSMRLQLGTFSRRGR